MYKNASQLSLELNSDGDKLFFVCRKMGGGSILKTKCSITQGKGYQNVQRRVTRVPTTFRYASVPLHRPGIVRCVLACSTSLTMEIRDVFSRLHVGTQDEWEAIPGDHVAEQCFPFSIYLVCLHVTGVIAHLQRKLVTRTCTYYCM